MSNDLESKLERAKKDLAELARFIDASYKHLSVFDMGQGLGLSMLSSAGVKAKQALNNLNDTNQTGTEENVIDERQLELNFESIEENVGHPVQTERKVGPRLEVQKT
ncbi:MAG TPA: hypothetical protein VFM18_00680 [Methanosarcina sp.]|nr:hypothetical protein [Methanosarcina sp.]